MRTTLWVFRQATCVTTLIPLFAMGRSKWQSPYIHSVIDAYRPSHSYPSLHHTWLVWTMPTFIFASSLNLFWQCAQCHEISGKPHVQHFWNPCLRLEGASCKVHAYIQSFMHTDLVIPDRVCTIHRWSEQCPHACWHHTWVCCHNAHNGMRFQARNMYNNSHLPLFAIWRSKFARFIHTFSHWCIHT